MIFHGTTILSVRKNKEVVVGGDGQVTLGNTIMKGNAKKVRRLYNQKVLAGFAGATADAFTLFEKFEAKLEKHSGHLTRSAVELAKDWRTDKILRNLEALLVVADKDTSLTISGNGDVIEPEDNIIAIGSGGPYAQAAAKALLENTSQNADEIVKKALEIALVENLQRANLSPLEEARGYEQLIKEFSHTQEKLGELVGKSRSHVANMIRLLNLPDNVKSLVTSRGLSAGHARALLNSSNPHELAKLVVKKGLNVRQTETLAKNAGVKGRKSPKKYEKDADTLNLEREISTSLGLNVSIHFTPSGGKVTVNYDLSLIHI